MRNKFLLVVLCLAILSAGCSAERNIGKHFKGMTQEELLLEMGRPTRTDTAPGGRKLSIYEKSKFLKPAPINTGAFQYDRFESPKTVKTETYTFTFNAAGVIDDVKYEVTYAR